MNLVFKFVAFVALILVTSCATKVPMNNAFYQQDKKVGILYSFTDSARIYTAGAQGVLDMVISKGRKYREPLKTLEELVDPTDEITSAVQAELRGLGKDYILINREDIANLPEFRKSWKFYPKDVRSLKEKYNIDQLMVVWVNYGLLIDYYGFIELSKHGYNETSIHIINLVDNRFLFSEKIEGSERIKDDWKANNHEAIKNAIINANNQSVQKIKEVL